MQDTDYVAIYNDLVQQANALGGFFKRVQRFSSEMLAEKRCKGMAEWVEAAKSKAASSETSTVSIADVSEQSPGPILTEIKADAPPPKAKVSKRKVTKAVKKPKGKAVSSPSEKLIVQILGDRSDGTKKAKLLSYLILNMNKPVALNKLVAIVYGNASKESTAAFQPCMKGLISTLQQHNKYTITRDKGENKEVTYVFCSKS